MKSKGLTQKRKNKHLSGLQSIPELEKGVNLIHTNSKKALLQKIVAREIKKQGEALWIDVGNNCSTYKLRKHGSVDLLNRVKIARAFTPLQHHSLVQKLDELIEDSTDLLVMPRTTFLYSEKDRNERELFDEVWKSVRTVKEDLKILASVNPEKRMARKVVSSAEKHFIACETQEGVLYKTKDHKQLFYKDKNVFQTTLSFWSGLNGTD